MHHLLFSISVYKIMSSMVAEQQSLFAFLSSLSVDNTGNCPKDGNYERS